MLASRIPQRCMRMRMRMSAPARADASHPPAHVCVSLRWAAGGVAARRAAQAAPMVLSLEQPLAASTPEVVERELASLSLEQLQALHDALMGAAAAVDAEP